MLGNLFEQKKKGVVFTVGRFNPPTVGHGKLIDVVQKEAKKRGYEHRIYATKSEDSKKNPLPFDKKVKYLSQFFPSANVVKKTLVGNPFDAAFELSDQGYEHVILVVGGDRVKELETGIRKYIAKGDIKFKSFKVVSAGKRDPDSGGVAGMSASKLRALALQSKEKQFFKGLPKSSDALKKSLYRDVRIGLGLSENYLLEQATKSKKPTVIVLTSTKNELQRTIARMRSSCEKRDIPFYQVVSKTAYVDANQESSKNIVINNYNGKGEDLKISPKKTICFVRGGVLNSEIGSAMISIIENFGVFVINERKVMELCANKLATAIELERHKVPTPKTAFVGDAKSIDPALERIGGKFPVVLKSITGAEGIGVSIVDSKASLKSVLQSLWKYGAETIIQEYMKIDFDVRTLVLDGQIFASAKREKAPEDFRTNVALGAKGGPYKLSDDEQDLIVKAAKVTGGFYVGVDHIRDKKGNLYVLEVNASPGSGNNYFSYFGGEEIESVNGDVLVDNLIDYCTNKGRWELSGREVGVNENIRLDGVKYPAKLDTGNDSYNAIHATDIKINEKNGTVSFKLNGEKKITKNLVSRVSIRSNNHSLEKRPVVEFDVKFRDLKFENVRFSLTDRTNNTFPVLLGVKFLKQTRVSVNVSKEFELPEETAAKTFQCSEKILNEVNRISKTYKNIHNRCKRLLSLEEKLIMSNYVNDARYVRSCVDEIKEKIYSKYKDIPININEEFNHYLAEVSPPSGPAKRFSKKEKVKREFKKRYGDRWKEVFYATAWKMYNKDKNEEIDWDIVPEVGKSTKRYLDQTPYASIEGLNDTPIQDVDTEEDE